MPITVNYSFLPVLLALLIISGSCKQNEKPLTKEEVMEFARQVEISIEKREAGFMDNAIDAKELMKRSGIPSSGRNEISFKKGLGQGLNMGTAIINALSAKGTYNLVRHYEKESVHHLLFRLYDGGKINYHDMELKRSAGRCMVADMYIYLTGENFSGTLNSIYLQMEDEISKSSGLSDETTQWAKKIPEIRSLVNNEQYNEAKSIFDALPEKIKDGRTFQIMNLQICSGLSNEEYETALQGFERRYPGEPNLQLLMLDGYVVRKEYDKALTAVDELDKMMGNDPLLDYYRSAFYSLKEDSPKSRECLERLIKKMPEFEDGLIELIDAYLAIGEYEKARPFVERFKNKSSFNQAALNMIMMSYPGYETGNNGE